MRLDPLPVCGATRDAAERTRKRRGARLARALALFALVALPCAASASTATSATVPPALLAAQQAKLVAGNGAGVGWMGYHVALAGDTALVGAPATDVGGSVDQGCVFVFTRSGSAWTQQACLTAAGGAAGDFFGYSIALSGETALIGARSDNVGDNANQGSAYVFTRSGSTWTQQARLTADDGAAGDAFGYYCALAGETALVASPFDDVGANEDQGSAYVFTGSGASWTQQAQLIAEDGAAADEFGHRTVLAGRMALVGARYDDVGANVDQGSVYVFSGSGATWTELARLVADEGAAGDQFGYSVALSGETALIGDASDDIGPGIDQGSAYVFGLDTPPVTTASLRPRPNSAGWNEAPVTITLAATDLGSGVAATEYRLVGSSVWTPYAAPFTVTTQGRSTFEHYSRDAVGNVEAAKTLVVRLDSVRPTTTAYRTRVTQGRRVRLAYKVNDTLPGCGKARVTIKVFRGATVRQTLKLGIRPSNLKQSVAWRCRLPRGRYTLKVYATDIAGNTQSKVGSALLRVR